MTDNYEAGYACVTTDSVVVTPVSIFISILNLTFRAIQIPFTKYSNIVFGDNWSYVPNSSHDWQNIDTPTDIFW